MRTWRMIWLEMLVSTRACWPSRRCRAPVIVESLLVQQRTDLADHQHVVALVVAPVAAPLDRLEVGELLLPIAQHMRFDPAQLADLTDGEVALGRDDR